MLQSDESAATHLAAGAGKAALAPTYDPSRTCACTVRPRATLTLFPGLGDDFRCALAHHLGDVQGAVGLVGDGDGTVHGFSLDLQKSIPV